jgi:hypothetical protein
MRWATRVFADPSNSRSTSPETIPLAVDLRLSRADQSDPRATRARRTSFLLSITLSIVATVVVATGRCARILSHNWLKERDPASHKTCRISNSPAVGCELAGRGITFLLVRPSVL